MSSMSYSTNRRRMGATALRIALLLVVLGAGVVIVPGVIERSDYSAILHWADSDLLPATEITRHYRELLQRHNPELHEIAHEMTPAQLAQALRTMDLWMPNLRALRKGEGDTAVITKEQVDALTECIQSFASRGSPSLRNDIAAERKRARLPDVVGMTMTEAWGHIHAQWGVTDPPPIFDFREQKPTPYHRPVPTPISSRVFTPLSIIGGSNFSDSWVAFRDPDDGYGFAYPSGWILRMQAGPSGSNSLITLCNRDIEYDPSAEPDGVFITVLEIVWFDPEMALSLEEYYQLCNVTFGGYACGPISLLPEGNGRPARAELVRSPADDDSPWIPMWSAYRNSSGKVIVFLSFVPMEYIREVQAVIDSFVLGNDTPIIAPDFEPAK